MALCLQNPEEEKGIMEGLRKAAAAVQSSEFAKAHERVLDQPGSTPVEVLQQLKQAAKVSGSAYQSSHHARAAQATGDLVTYI